MLERERPAPCVSGALGLVLTHVYANRVACGAMRCAYNLFAWKLCSSRRSAEPRCAGSAMRSMPSLGFTLHTFRLDAPSASALAKAGSSVSTHGRVKKNGTIKNGNSIGIL